MTIIVQIDSVLNGKFCNEISGSTVSLLSWTRQFNKNWRWYCQTNDCIENRSLLDKDAFLQLCIFLRSPLIHLSSRLKHFARKQAEIYIWATFGWFVYKLENNNAYVAGFDPTLPVNPHSNPLEDDGTLINRWWLTFRFLKSAIFIAKMVACGSGCKCQEEATCKPSLPWAKTVRMRELQADGNTEDFVFCCGKW